MGTQGTAFDRAEAAFAASPVLRHHFGSAAIREEVAAWGRRRRRAPNDVILRSALTTRLFPLSSALVLSWHAIAVEAHRKCGNQVGLAAWSQDRHGSHNQRITFAGIYVFARMHIARQGGVAVLNDMRRAA